MTYNGKDLFIAIDANAIVHRAFHAYPPTLATSTGLQDNAVYGFTVMLLQILKQFDPKYIFCAFDTGKPTFRHVQFTDYKGHRKPVDASLTAQFPLVQEVLRAFNIPIIEKEGFEADDILGTVSKWVSDGKWASYNLSMLLVTGDRDLLQLVDKNVSACLPSGSFSNIITYDKEKVIEKYGYSPEQVTDYKALVGDASDNIPGVKGIGEKTALGLLYKYQTLDNLYKNMNEVDQRYRTKLAEGTEQAYFSKDLATIKRDVDISLQLEDCVVLDFDEQKLLDVFAKFEFRTLVNKIPKSINGAKKSKPQFDMFSEPGEQMDGVEEISDLVPSVTQAKRFIIAYIGTKDKLLCSTVDNLGQVSVSLTTPSTLDILCSTISIDCETYIWDWEELVSQIKVGTVNAFMKAKSVDLQLLVFSISSGKKDFSLETVLFDSLSFKSDSEDYMRIGKALVDVIKVIEDKVEGLEMSEYVVEGWKNAGESLKEEIASIEDMLRCIEMPVSAILQKMEKRGIAVDVEVLKGLEERLNTEIEKIRKSIYEDIGHEVNLNSPKQLSDVIYNELSVPDVLGSKRGRSTREEVLIEIQNIHPAISKILKYRELSKVQNTYVIPYREVVEKSRVAEIHTDFKQMGASSGRFSSVNPNMQNIPVRGEWGDEIRKIFIPRSGYVFIGADYSQIEFRVMADISMDEALLHDFATDGDIHRATASRIFKKDEKDVTKEERSLGKTINFGILFGQTQYGLASMLGVDRETAQKYIEEYFGIYKGVKRYIDEASKNALKTGYVQSMLGRTRYIAGLTSRNFNVRNAAVREAVNMPIQGGEADIMKIAMIKIDRLIEGKYKDKAYILLQVHDEFIFEVLKGYEESFSKEVKEIMVNAVKLSVPLDVHISTGNNMSELK